MIEKWEKQILRDLAMRVKEISEEPIQKKLKKEWTMHNDMKRVAPRVLIYPDGDGAWREILSDNLLKTINSEARSIEMNLMQRIYHWENFKDDTVFEDIFRIDCPGDYTGYHYGKADQKTAWGLEIKKHMSGIQGGAYGFESSLNSEEDLDIFLNHKLDFIEYKEEKEKRISLLEDIFQGILNIEVNVPYSALVASLLSELVHLRGLGEIMMDLYDNPEMFHKVMEHMSNQKIMLLRKLESEGRLSLNNRDHYTGSGGVGYTEELPQKDFDGNVRIKDLWGFADTQEFTDVSAEMFREFVLPYQVNALKEFGLVSYGCCERIDKKLDDILSIPNIRRISVSPWTNVNIAAEKIQRKAIFSRKPNPAFVSTSFDREAIEKDLKETIKAAENCNLEIILKDIRTCNSHPEYLSKWIALAQSLCK